METEYKLYEDGCSITEISDLLGIPKSTIRFRLKKKGILRTRVEGVRLAAKKGKLGHMKGTKRHFSKEWKKNMSISRLRWAENNAKGFSLKPSGYLEITRGKNKGRGLHCVIMEEYLGRPLERGEIVHHVDGVRDNNEIENLELMTRSEHSRCHRLREGNLRKRDIKGRFK